MADKHCSRKWLLMKWVFAVGTAIQLTAMLLKMPYPVEYFAFLGMVSSVYFGANSYCKITGKKHE